MEAVGSEVFVALLPLIVVLSLACYTFAPQIKQLYKRVHLFVFGPQQNIQQDPANRPPMFGQQQCSICLDEPKKFQIAGTCGHSFCSQCLFSIYERTGEKLICPLCRKSITTIFKCFNNQQQPADTRGLMITKIHQYNQRFDDNRPLIRRLQQFPYVLRRIGRYMLTPQFWFGFMRSFHFIRIVLLAFVYLIIPLDLIPQRVFGIIGLIDDIFILGFLVLIGVALFAPIFIRRDR